MNVEFFVPGEPKGKGRPRFRHVASKNIGGKGFVQTYTPSTTVVYENAIKVFASQCMRSTPPTKEAVFVVMVVVFTPPESWSKKKRTAALDGTYQHVSKPDGDNVQKAVFDGLQGVVVVDDKQIYGHALLKKYGWTPGVHVHVTDLPPSGWFGR